MAVTFAFIAGQKPVAAKSRGGGFPLAMSGAGAPNQG